MTPKKSAPSFSQEELDNRRRQFARILFLEQLDTTCQHVRKDLLKIWKKLESRIRAAISASQKQLDEAFDTIREEVLAKYDAPGEGAIGVSGPTQNVWGWYRGASQGGDPLRDQLESDIREWAQGYWIDTDWIINMAVENISKWFQDPAQERRKSWFPPSVGMLGSLPPEASEFQFRLPQAWEPMFHRPAVVRKRIKAAFKQALQEWMDRTEKLAKELGFQEVRKRSELEKHIGWLIRHRVLRQNYTEIARKDLPTKREDYARVTVTSGIDSASKLIGFDPA